MSPRLRVGLLDAAVSLRLAQPASGGGSSLPECSCRPYRTRQLRFAGVASTFPAASIARAWNVCFPFFSLR